MHERIVMTYECRHIMHNGAKCQSPSLRGKPYCYYHTRLHRFTAAPPPGPMDTIRIPVLEDRTAIQVALSQVLNDLASGRLDPKRVGLFLYGLQIATQIVERQGEVIPRETVETMTQTDTGEELGPKERICIDENCPTCPERGDCEFCDLDDEEDEEANAPAARQTLSAAQCVQRAVNRILPTVHGTASTAECSAHTAQCCAPLHSFTSSLIHCPSSQLTDLGPLITDN